MTVLPLIHRELGNAARKGSTYRLRILGALALLTAVTVFNLVHPYGYRGEELFSLLHSVLFWAIWAFVPFLTADALSRELREGTLGLLMLTSVREFDVVLAKMLAHWVRAFTFWLATVPVLLLPFFLGGIGWREGLLSCAVNFSCILMALTAGLLASVLSRVWTRVLLLVIILSATFFLIYVTGHSALILQGLGYLKRVLSDRFLHHLGDVIALSTDGDGCWSLGWNGISRVQRRNWAIGELITLAGAAAFCIIVLRLVAYRVRTTWRDKVRSARALRMLAAFCRPVYFVPLFRRWMARKLEKNPVGWLELRSWSGRLVTWCWLGLIVLLCSFILILPDAFTDSGTSYAMAGVMGGSLALSAAASFRRERETGVIELLLVSPVGERGIISGRIRGLWGQFIPGSAVLLAVWLYGSHLMGSLGEEDSPLSAMLFCASALCTTPVIGLYFSLVCRHFVVALVGAVVCALMLPQALANVAGVIWWLYFGERLSSSWGMAPSLHAALWQWGVAAFCWKQLHRRLRLRDYPERAD